MLSWLVRTNSAQHPRYDNRMPSERDGSFVPRSAMLRPMEQCSLLNKGGEQSTPPSTPSDFHPGGISDHTVTILPADAVTRRRLAPEGVAVDRREPPARGGLAAWQQRIVSAYIEEHIAEQIPLGTFARLVRLSPYHLCRAFKRSFGVPPHRYHNARRIEHATMLLAQPTCSVTQIALRLGFSETGSFTAAFRKATGSTPTAYRRSLG